MSKWETWFKARNWTVIVTSGVLIVVYCVTLHRAWTGSRYRIVMGCIALLTVSNVGYLVEAVVYLTKGFIDGKNLNETIIAVSHPLGNLCFGVAHWILAIFYYRIAKNMPRVLDGNENEVQSYQTAFWVGLVFNLIFPIVESVTWVYQANAESYHRWDYWTYFGAFNGDIVCWIVSGFVLICSIKSIKSYLKWRGEDDGQHINIKQLLLHSSAFGLYVGSVIIFQAAYLCYFIGINFYFDTKFFWLAFKLANFA